MCCANSRGQSSGLWAMASSQVERHQRLSAADLEDGAGHVGVGHEEDRRVADVVDRTDPAHRQALGNRAAKIVEAMEFETADAAMRPACPPRTTRPAGGWRSRSSPRSRPTRSGACTVEEQTGEADREPPCYDLYLGALLPNPA